MARPCCTHDPALPPPSAPHCSLPPFLPGYSLPQSPEGQQAVTPWASFAAGRKEWNGADGTQGDVPLRGAVAASAPTGAQHASSPRPLTTVSQCNPLFIMAKISQ